MMYISVYLRAVGDLINEEFDKLLSDVQVFNSHMTKCSSILNDTSEACQSCLEVVNCER